MAGSKPGERRGGRKKGSRNKKVAAKIAAVEASGLTPLDYMLAVMRDENRKPYERLDAAKSAAPYVHPRLASTELSTKDGKPLIVNIVNYGRDSDSLSVRAPELPAPGTDGAG